MLKKIAALAIAVSMQTVCFADGMQMDINADNNNPKTGETIEVSFDISGNEGFNNYTFFVDYDNDFYELADIPDMSGCIKFGSADVISAEDAAVQKNVVPTASDEDFSELGADGKKTASQLGRIKFAGFDEAMGTANGNGSILKLNFKIKGTEEQSGEIKVTPVDTGFEKVPQTDGNSKIDVVYNSLTLTAASDAEFTVDESGTVTDVQTASENVNIPSNINGVTVTSIGDSFLKGNASIKKVTIPDTVTEIGSSAFEGCTALESVNVPESVVSFGDYAFAGCENLKDINIPKDLKKMGVYVFEGCKNIKNLNFR